jgi:hypothetical protein
VGGRRPAHRKGFFNKSPGNIRGIIPHIDHATERLTQRTVKIIRWSKNHLDLERDWDEAMAKPSRILSVITDY